MPPGGVEFEGEVFLLGFAEVGEVDAGDFGDAEFVGGVEAVAAVDEGEVGAEDDGDLDAVFGDGVLEGVVFGGCEWGEEPVLEGEFFAEAFKQRGGFGGGEPELCRGLLNRLAFPEFRSDEGLCGLAPW